MAAVFLLRTSRLRFFALKEAKGFTFWTPADGLPAPLPPALDDTEYEVKARDVIDNIAQKNYGDPFLWWVAAKTNSLRLLPFDLLIGSRIRIPAQRRVDQQLL